MTAVHRIYYSVMRNRGRVTTTRYAIIASKYKQTYAAKKCRLKQNHKVKAYLSLSRSFKIRFRFAIKKKDAA